MDTPTGTGDPIAARIREAREYVGFTVADVAGYLGWSPVLIEGIEDGTVTPDDGRLATLGKLYHRPVAWFRDETTFEPPEWIMRDADRLHPGDLQAVLDFAEFLQCKKRRPRAMADDLHRAVAEMLHDHRQHVSENFPAPGICVSRCSDAQPRWPCGAYRAASAVEAVLKLADDWDAEAKRIDGIFAGDEDPWPRTVGGMRSEAFETCAKALREATRTALAGKAGDGA